MEHGAEFIPRRPASDSVSLGLAINAPFGLKLDYAGNWLGQYQGVYSELRR